MRASVQSTRLRRAIHGDPVKVIAVTSGKGGVGKTSISANIAIALGQRRRNVMLLDADLGLANADVLLGLQPQFNLAHVVRGEAELDSTLLNGPCGVRLVPASSGDFSMLDMPPQAQAALIQAFSALREQPDVLVVDTAAGISDSVARFVQAAQEVVVVVCDEPSSLTDAYALVKVLSSRYGITRFRIVTNQTRDDGDGRALFTKLRKVSDLYLDVVLQHLGNVPYDGLLKDAVQEQRAVVEAYPRSTSGQAFRRIAGALDALPAPTAPSGGTQFFLERLLDRGAHSHGRVA